MRDIEVCTDALLECIHKSNIYQKYLECEREISKSPGLKEQVDDLKRASYQLYQEEDWFEVSERLDEKFSGLSKNPEMNAYLEAEQDLCKMIRKVAIRFYESLDLEIPQM